MHIHHISLCTTQMDRMVTFYKTYFGAVEHAVYHNPKTGLRTCSLQFDKGAILEVTTRPGFTQRPADHSTGYAHIALSVGDADGVDFLTRRLADDGYIVVSQPRVTGDGYYESTVQDPDGNWIEITGGRRLPPGERGAEPAQESG
ncbi:VOC family protein [Ruminococcaceae bacterium OttesenSCG-928-O06]|nr:VOC family protein [Ruminococcaceae bacterium OttesenSCG-928-O06]